MSTRRRRELLPLSAAGAHAIALGQRLNALNTLRGLVSGLRTEPMTPVGAAWLMYLADLDAGRRALRLELAAALEAAERQEIEIQTIGLLLGG